jgi:Zn-dependent protease with chaperone function
LIKGWWYPAGSSARHGAELSVTGVQFSVSVDHGDALRGNINDLEISARVGNIPRKVAMPDQSLFETQDNDGVDQLLAEYGLLKGVDGALHHLETHWRWIGIALIATLVIGFSTFYWGMPWASKKIAFTLPPSVLEMVADQTLKVMDQTILEESELPQQQQQLIREHFDEKLLSASKGEYTFQLHFRNIEGMANAFALPSGDIIVTDRLIELSDSQEQIDSVLLHEMGHVVGRHGMQRILHSSFLTVAIILVSGDVTAIENIAVAFPVFLLESHYSREDEDEADKYAFESMLRIGIDPMNFSTIMEKLSSYNNQDSDHENKSDNADPSGKRPIANGALEYLSSHPATQDRIEQANHYSALFKKRRSEQVNAVSQ